MAWLEKKEILAQYLKKYRFLALAVLAGAFLMLVPEKTQPQETVQPVVREEAKSLQEALEQILCRVQGAGEVRVLLTEAEGSRTIFQSDEDCSQTDTRRDTVIVSGTDRSEGGLVQQTLAPVYQGAVIVCEGGDDPAVRLSVVMAVMSATGLTSDHITVLKMD